MKTLLKFKVNALRTLASPYKKSAKNDEQYETIYYLLVNMKDLPSNIPLDVNPRKPKLTTNVAKRLLKAVTSPETDFYINNRGIVIAAKSLSFNSQNSEVTIDMGDQTLEDDRFSYGILDGGHTYTAILKNRTQIPNDIEQYVRVEVITNVQNIRRLSDARNTSVQVSDIALFNLDNNFDSIKTAIAKEPYAKKIAYKDNEDNPINVSELLRLMYAFDIDKYPNDTVAPVQSYSGKAQVFKRYQEAFKTPLYQFLIKELPVLVQLYDTIELELAIAYKNYKLAMGVKSPKFGSVKGIEAKNNMKTTFLNRDTNYIISTGYIYPIFGAFRSLLKYNEDKKIQWIFNPLDIWKEVNTSLAQTTFETHSNPQLAGKDKQLWLSNYRTVEAQSLRNLLKNRK